MSTIKTYYAQVPLEIAMKKIEQHKLNEVSPNLTEKKIKIRKQSVQPAHHPEKEPNVSNPCPIDIFRVDHQGVRWLGSATTIEDAKARVQQFGERHSGEYLVLNQVTGNKFTFTACHAVAAST